MQKNQGCLWNFCRLSLWYGFHRPSWQPDNSHPPQTWCAWTSLPTQNQWCARFDQRTGRSSTVLCRGAESSRHASLESCQVNQNTGATTAPRFNISWTVVLNTRLHKSLWVEDGKAIKSGPGCSYRVILRVYPHASRTCNQLLMGLRRPNWVSTTKWQLCLP